MEELTQIKSYSDLATSFQHVRNDSVNICHPLEIEDTVVQPAAHVSPPKWHLAHTTWFFEEFILRPYGRNYRPFNSQYGHFFNSYYKGIGKHWEQSKRGLLSRPTLEDILQYRHYVDTHIADIDFTDVNILETLILGLHHEQQHQELLLMDIKYILGQNPIRPLYSNEEINSFEMARDDWFFIPYGEMKLGHQGHDLVYDNERPAHRYILQETSMRTNLVSNREYLEFIEDGGYRNPLLWCSDGLDWIQSENVKRPLYWVGEEQIYEYTLRGLEELDLNSPVCHISFYEADAFANWKGMRLPTEAESEYFLKNMPEKNIEIDSLHTTSVQRTSQNLWWWTSSDYSAYPGFQAFSGPAQEYNGKFMCNQKVLRGGSFATASWHYRHTYRNFYRPHQRWMFSGIRLAQKVKL